MKGKIYEDLACRYLKKKGYKIIERNYRTRFGEIDIIAAKSKVLVFVEVKGGKGEPRFRVDQNKLKKIELAANEFLSSYSGRFKEIRLDVLEVTDGGVTHIKGVEL